MVTRTRRKRTTRRGLCAYRRHELLTGEVILPVLGYTGYAPDGTLEVTDGLRSDWSIHRDALLRYWISDEAPHYWQRLPWLFHMGAAGTRPWAWWQFDAPEPRGDESEAAYLDRLGLWLKGERELLAEQSDTLVAAFA